MTLEDSDQDREGTAEPTASPAMPDVGAADDCGREIDLDTAYADTVVDQWQDVSVKRAANEVMAGDASVEENATTMPSNAVAYANTLAYADSGHVPVDNQEDSGTASGTVAQCSLEEDLNVGSGSDTHAHIFSKQHDIADVVQDTLVVPSTQIQADAPIDAHVHTTPCSLQVEPRGNESERTVDGTREASAAAQADGRGGVGNRHSAGVAPEPGEMDGDSITLPEVEAAAAALSEAARAAAGLSARSEAPNAALEEPKGGVEDAGASECEPPTLSASQPSAERAACDAAAALSARDVTASFGDVGAILGHWVRDGHKRHEVRLSGAGPEFCVEGAGVSMPITHDGGAWVLNGFRLKASQSTAAKIIWERPGRQSEPGRPAFPSVTRTWWRPGEAVPIDC